MRERMICKIADDPNRIHLTYHYPTHQGDPFTLCEKRVYSWPRTDAHDISTWVDTERCPECDKVAAELDRDYF